jgi:protein TonB
MSGLGNLSQCMVDSDPEAISRARRLRQKALVISVFLEAVCLAAMLLWPLITPGVFPHGYITTPVPPYRGGVGNPGAPRPQRHKQAPPHKLQPTQTEITYTPVQSARHQERPSDDDAPSLEASTGAGTGSGAGPIGPTIFGSDDKGRPVQPPREPESVRPIRQAVSEGVMEGALIHRVEPAYPMIARNMRLTGIVRLRAIIATDGSVQHLEVLSGSEILSRAARQAVEQWRYRPTLLNGVPVEVETLITVTFVLGDH